MKKNLYNLKVVKVLSDFQVVINAGSEDGVQRGMSFVIFSDGEEIKDPDSGESLGRLEIVKGNVVVVHTQPTMSIASTENPSQSSTRNSNAFAEAMMQINQRRLFDPQVNDRARRTS